MTNKNYSVLIFTRSGSISNMQNLSKTEALAIKDYLLPESKPDPVEFLGTGVFGHPILKRENGEVFTRLPAIKEPFDVVRVEVFRGE